LLQRRITMLNQSTQFANSRTRRGFTALIALAVVCSIPWTVTAQTATMPVATPIVKKPVHAHKRHVAKHVVAKKATKAKPAVVIARSGNSIGVPMTPRSVKAPVGLTTTLSNSTVIAYGGAKTPVATSISRPMLVGSGGSKTPVATIFQSSSSNQVRTVTAPAGAKQLQSRSVYGIQRGVSVPAEPPLVQLDGDKRINLEMHSASLIEALRTLFKTAGVDFSIKSTVENDSVTCMLKGVTFTTALKTILQSGRQELTYRMEDDVFMIEPKYPNALGGSSLRN
jgi:hypothetical protein